MSEHAATRPQTAPRTRLSEIADWLGAEVVQPRGAAGDRMISGLTLSTFRAQPGDLYAALPGARTHGAGYVDAAIESGVVAVLTDAEGAGLLAGDVPVLVVDRPRAVLGDLAAQLYGYPARSLRMIGVTGTQGKTTTTRLADGGLLAAGVPSAVIGTVGTRIGGAEVRTTLTTPEAPDLHALFALMVEMGMQACAMEVSSHALVQGRVDGVLFDVACFTNLGRDHLDFHDTVEEYFQAKASLFTPQRARRGLVNVEDPYGRRLLEQSEIEMRTFSVGGADADWRAVEIDSTAAGSTFTVLTPSGERIPAGVPLAGGFNVANALTAIAACAEVGYDPAAIAAGISQGAGVPGRLESVSTDAPARVVVDYAHKPDAVEAALAALRPLTEGRLIVVLGAGGERDHGKRPIMGEIAARLADRLIVTDDNPRGEEPSRIRREVLGGVSGSDRGRVEEVDGRRAAIRTALADAREGDIVLIAGKGHETGQEIAGVVHPFDDREVAREEAASLYGAER